jgi:hypothetical protein
LVTESVFFPWRVHGFIDAKFDAKMKKNVILFNSHLDGNA